ncbi:hypothetical protein [Paraburkholderia terricola]|uniref:Uncharacterized protein n=1 Tax=Paraburkholderia terricola TaxID=169427 RepID=A0ABU1LY62_9BURK|nr:hypothetical protein [Paraburkholderia terricola]MDR6411699.1 hypothetical protein [Paraburkholderia terricola]MDR6449131.1 hypothetical protein [Paraburkholderia terricola]MDR6484018.1 hypothetical protein [Paraburkholderia terricola]
MIEFFSPAVLAAVLRVSSSPIFSVRLATASPLKPRDAQARAVGCASRPRAAHEGMGRV